MCGLVSGNRKLSGASLCHHVSCLRACLEGTPTGTLQEGLRALAGFLSLLWTIWFGFAVSIFVKYFRFTYKALIKTKNAYSNNSDES